MTDHPHPGAPMQVIAPDWQNLPRYDPDIDGPAPRWVHNVIRAWARGSVEIIPDAYRFIDHRPYSPAFVLDGVEWDWRHDGEDVWTLIHILPDSEWTDVDDDIPLKNSDH
ncbi:hypothetical protein [Sulfitobacter dubius]|uniref:hypothetical protein n=1 Tax=Sulfitobacter dubius TaxID=218673 RepID=UPI0022AEA8E8|nr:hypothetical protein [Sulfitobacter dubius]MCZ4366657.1 hypothetical protein [Sulfitobacter dubius]